MLKKIVFQDRKWYYLETKSESKQKKIKSTENANHMGKCIFFSLGGKFSSFNNTNLFYSFVSQKSNAVLIGLKSRYRQGTFLSRVFRRESFYLFQLIEVINIFWLMALLFHLQSRQHLISLSLSPYSHLPLIIAGKKLSAVKDFCG